MTEDLLTTARILAGHGSGRPKQTMLRRAVSTAYYAMFHRVCRLAADELVGYNAPWELYSLVYRSVEHRVARDVLARLRTSDDAAIGTIPEVFARLQRDRHLSDYDPQPLNLTKARTLDIIDEAAEGVRLLDELEPAVRKKLAVLLTTRQR